MELLINASTTPKGVGLAQNGLELYVYTDCCGTTVEATDSFNEARCVGCMRVIAANPSGWISEINLEEDGHHRPEGWHRWLSYWFELSDDEELAMEVSWNE